MPGAGPLPPQKLIRLFHVRRCRLLPSPTETTTQSLLSQLHDHKWSRLQSRSPSLLQPLGPPSHRHHRSSPRLPNHRHHGFSPRSPSHRHHRFNPRSPNHRYGKFSSRSRRNGHPSPLHVSIYLLGNMGPLDVSLTSPSKYVSSLLGWFRVNLLITERGRRG